MKKEEIRRKEEERMKGKGIIRKSSDLEKNYQSRNIKKERNKEGRIRRRNVT